MAYIKLRDYQQEALKSVQEAWKEGINHQLIVLPTGVLNSQSFQTPLKRLAADTGHTANF